MRIQIESTHFNEDDVTPNKWYNVTSVDFFDIGDFYHFISDRGNEVVAGDYQILLIDTDVHPYLTKFKQ